MERFRTRFNSFQNAVIQLLLISSLCLTVTLSQVLTPDDAKNILRKHNEYRKQESASDMYLLHWNVSLQARADSWAQQCTFKHERNQDVGENLFFDTDHKNDVFIRGLDAWHKEKSNWGYSSHSCKANCHFTQIVWGYTTTVGCSANVCPSLTVSNRVIKDAMLFICYYYPRGNFIGNFPYSRGSPCSECAAGDTCVDNLCVSSGPDSKRAPDFVKQLLPKTPNSWSSYSHKFQAFKSLIQQTFTSTSQEGQGRQQQIHHHSEHHEQQQQHFKSETVVSSRSASHSYSAQHSRSSQQDRHVYHSSQRYQQQHLPGPQVNGENNWLKEQEREQGQQQEEKKRQEIIQQERQHREKIEKRRQEFIQEQERQTALDQQRQHLLAQKRKQAEEEQYLETLKRQEEERKRKDARDLADTKRQTDEETRRKLEEERKQYEVLQRSRQERYKQPLLEAVDNDHSRVLSTQSRRDERTEYRIAANQPTETYRVTESPYDYNARSRYYPNGNQERTTFGGNIRTNNQDRRSQGPTQSGHSRSEHDSTASRAGGEYRRTSENQQIFSSRSHGSLTAQSSAVGEVVKLLTYGVTDKTIGRQQQYQHHNELLPAERNSQAQQSGSSFHTRDTSDRDLDSESQAGFIYNDYEDDNNEESNRATDIRQSVDELDASGRRKQPQENRTKHLKKKWMYRQSEKKELEKSHRHKDNYVMETDGRRCVDRHEECTRWAVKCHKSSAVTLTCPMSCGKCGLHLTADSDVQLDQTTENNANGRTSLALQRNERRNKQTPRDLTPAERKTRREERRLEHDRNAPSALMARPTGNTAARQQSTARQQPTARQQSTARTVEERPRRKERRRQEKQRHNQARQDLCRDDPKHIKSCKYWTRKGFCLDNKLIASIYCQHSCNQCP